MAGKEEATARRPVEARDFEIEVALELTALVNADFGCGRGVVPESADNPTDVSIHFDFFPVEPGEMPRGHSFAIRAKATV
ncbi:hypothetical protein GGQ67_003419 [Rhizobium metallidurans]|uniref:Uncharacterized protein n=1 Tax=Rhizobium metallidurans TaxID=1265931 RepID=A0A7W6CT54_9HYPH|nr:hypothetical protein [Rhizobium metallidurans]